MAASPEIHKAAGIIVRDRKLLVERSKDKVYFISPGGSIEDGETAKQALIRELMEEFQIGVEEEDLEPFGVFRAPAAGQEHRIVELKTFIVNRWNSEPTPDNEVEEIAWVTSDTTLPLGSIFAHEVMPKLKADEIID